MGIKVMVSFKRFVENNKINIDVEYWNQIHKSPNFRKIDRMKKLNLIKELGKKLWRQNNQTNRLFDEEKVIANQKWSQREMAYLLYKVEWNNVKIPI
jgi:hypothetical protein